MVVVVVVVLVLVVTRARSPSLAFLKVAPETAEEQRASADF